MYPQGHDGKLAQRALANTTYLADPGAAALLARADPRPLIISKSFRPDVSQETGW